MSVKNLFLLGAILCSLSRAGAEVGSFPYTLRWKRLVGAPVHDVLAQRDSLIFVADADGRVLALERENGLRVWQYRSGGRVRQGLVLNNGLLVFANSRGRVQALDWGSGEERWAVRQLGRGSATIEVCDALLYSSSADGWFYALGIGDGAQAWRLRTGLRIAGDIAIAGGNLFVGTRDGPVAVDALSGTRLRHAVLDAPIQAGPVVVRGRVLVACADGYVRAYRSGDLEHLWERRLAAHPDIEMLVVGDRLVCAVDNGQLYGLNWKDGRLVWRRDLGEKPSGAPVLGPRGEVLAPIRDGRIIALEAENGGIQWEAQVLDNAALQLWVEGVGLYVSGADGYLYAFESLDGDQQRRKRAWEGWWEVVESGHKSGYLHQTIDDERIAGEKAWRIRAEAVMWRGGFRRIASEILADRSYRPLAFAHRVVEGSQLVETRGAWVGGKVELEQQLAGRIVRREIVLREDAIMPEVALLKLAQEGRAVHGRRDSLWVFDGNSFAVRKLYCAFEDARNRGEGIALEVRLRWEDALFPEAEILTWIDDQGREVRSQIPALSRARLRVPARRARAWSIPGKARRIRLGHAIEEPGRLEKMVLELPFELGAAQRLLVEDERQQIVRSEDGGLELHIQRLEYTGRDALKLPILAAEMAPYLEPSLYVQTEDERIRELVRQLRGGERNSWEVARRLQEWVYDHMVPRNTNVRFKSSLEVLEDMEGTCSEYAVLFMALCRAAGVPARACVGFLVSQSGDLVLHIWTQVYVGRWVDMDPSWAQASVDAAHIKTGQGRLAGLEMRQLNEPLQFFLARVDSLKLVEYQSGEIRFLALAEELYVAAEAAERHYIDERAQELYHQILLLPWNHRSGAACINIGRYRLRRHELKEAVWALERVLERDPQGAAADDALFYLARVAQERGESATGLEYLEQLVEVYPDHDLADDALAELGKRYERERGCEGARPYFERLRVEYAESGWAAVAASALERCAAAPAQSVEVDGNR